MLRACGIALVLLALVWAVPRAAWSQADRLVVLVRHAEASGEPRSDPPLSIEGRARADALARVLDGAKIGAVIVSARARTALTAAPVADARGIVPIVADVAGGLDDHVNAVVAAVRRQAPGEAVLVVGHSNTIPAIIAALGGPKLADLCHGEFSRLFVLQLSADGPPRLIQASYGAPDGELGECP